jgi:hypothetical protein
LSPQYQYAVSWRVSFRRHCHCQLHCVREVFSNLLLADTLETSEGVDRACGDERGAKEFMIDSVL